ncbi:hypothetical protein SVAN01_06183 [Stagonosporopsis vannaccii]|nr:hypothetical protein SVAN01_06183 [Stagonosporopsis vannaccii]
MFDFPNSRKRETASATCLKRLHNTYPQHTTDAPQLAKSIISTPSVFQAWLSTASDLFLKLSFSWARLFTGLGQG